MNLVVTKHTDVLIKMVLIVLIGIKISEGYHNRAREQ
jgi:hypothetical protein